MKFLRTPAKLLLSMVIGGIAYFVIGLLASAALEFMGFGSSIFASLIGLLGASVSWVGSYRVLGQFVDAGNRKVSKLADVRHNSSRLCIILCGVQLILIPLLTIPYWSGDGHATPIALWMYVVTWALALLLFVATFLKRDSRWVGFGGLAWIPFIAALTYGGKWLLIVVLGKLEWFHGGMGLGEEILGPIPNMIFDGLISVVLFALALALLVHMKVH